jgi:phage terminase small subunit
MSLTPKQQAFVDEYLIDLNATQAAIRAGYSENSAEVTGCKLLRNAKVAEFVQRAMDERADKAKVDGARVLEEIGHSAFVDPVEYFDKNGHLLPIHDMPESARRSIASIKVRREKGEIDEDGKQTWDTVTELKVNDKSRNLELYGRHLKLFTDKLEVTTDEAEALAERLQQARERSTTTGSTD